MPRIDLDQVLAPHPHARELLEDLSRADYRTVIVGGTVRDALLGKYEEDFDFDPETTDIDIATSASPEEIKEVFPEYNFLEVGESFGVLVLVAPDENQYEVAQFRMESDYDGRRPGKVKPAHSLEEDVKRRDFTVNGLALDLDGQVIDLVDGISDLKKKVVRAIGDPLRRFREDYLRPLRAIRVACYLGGEIEAETEKAIEEVASEITSISQERIREELFRILRTPRSGWGLRLCHKTGLLDQILPEMTANEGIPQPEKYHPEGDVLEHSFQGLEVADELEFGPLTKFAVFIHDVGKADAYHNNDKQHMGGHALIGRRKTKEIASRLRLSNEETKKLTWIVENHMRGSVLPKMRRAKQVKLVRSHQDKNFSIDAVTNRFDYFTTLLKTIIADSEASSHGVKGWLPVLQEFSSLLPHLKHLEDLGTARELIDGNDLIELGLQEGPVVGEVLESLHEKIYSGEIETREAALKEAAKLVEGQS
ncbi:CCA tRNA nucleotidyltransferase [Candidatus Bipolaricaulota bacterium]|nr:CCA tRNA nucleotidyltransferase [Candidatus Bipolaricaulota bacterium]